MLYAANVLSKYFAIIRWKKDIEDVPLNRYTVHTNILALTHTQMPYIHYDKNFLLTTLQIIHFVIIILKWIELTYHYQYSSSQIHFSYMLDGSQQWLYSNECET